MVLSFRFSLAVSIPLSPCLQWLPVPPFLVLHLRAQLNLIPTWGPRFVPTQTLEDTIAAALSGKTWSFVSSYFTLVPASALDLLQHLVQCEFLVFSTSDVWPCLWPVLCSGVLAVSRVQCSAWTSCPNLGSGQLLWWFWLCHCSSVSQISGRSPALL